MNFKVPQPGSGLLFGGNLNKPEIKKILEYLTPMGYKFFAADPAFAQGLRKLVPGVKVEAIEFPKTDKRKLREVFEAHGIKGCFNLADKRAEDLLDVDYVMRRNAVDFNVPLFMEPKTAQLFAQCLSEKLPLAGGIPGEVRRWSEFIGGKPL